jgi:hypothetical protein
MHCFASHSDTVLTDPDWGPYGMRRPGPSFSRLPNRGTILRVTKSVARSVRQYSCPSGALVKMFEGRPEPDDLARFEPRCPSRPAGTLETMKRIMILMLSLGVFVSGPAFSRDKTDTVWIINGNQITGEIKKLEHGLLTLKTDYMGEVKIEWTDVLRVESDYAFQLEKTDGTRVTGRIQESTEPGMIIVGYLQQQATFEAANVVRMSQIEDTFFDRLKGSLSMGYSFTKASDVAQGNFSFSATHRTEIRSFTLQGSTISTSTAQGVPSRRANASFDMTRFRRDRWYNTYQLGLEQNDELGLELRTSLEASLGRYLIQTNTSELGALVGLVGTNELLQGNVQSQQNLEGLLGVEYSRYIYSDPKLDLTASLYAYPSITESNRKRAQFDVGLRWEIYKDLFWNLSYYNTYDSKPASGSETNDDYGVVTSVGWSF